MKDAGDVLCKIPGCKYPVNLNTWYVSRKTGRKYPIYRDVCALHHRCTFCPYMKYRKDYCENRDGRLGFVCGWRRKFFFMGMLQVDHIKGRSGKNPHRPSNLQTLCANCHTFKSNQDTESRHRSKHLHTTN